MTDLWFKEAGANRAIASLPKNWSYQIPMGVHSVGLAIKILGAFNLPNRRWYKTRRGHKMARNFYRGEARRAAATWADISKRIAAGQIAIDMSSVVCSQGIGV